MKRKRFSVEQIVAWLYDRRPSKLSRAEWVRDPDSAMTGSSHRTSAVVRWLVVSIWPERFRRARLFSERSQ